MTVHGFKMEGFGTKALNYFYAAGLWKVCLEKNEHRTSNIEC